MEAGEGVPDAAVAALADTAFHSTLETEENPVLGVTLMYQLVQDKFVENWRVNA